ncbi:hypothetical protein [Marinicellulosiphila megalodicopiae]|uniref:hypothetical protein n=1 Tax=Marinicellulosiphila megalodicopiae TaxID=2724896 RepID=UPI003BAF8F9D
MKYIVLCVCLFVFQNAFSKFNQYESEDSVFYNYIGLGDVRLSSVEIVGGIYSLLKENNYNSEEDSFGININAGYLINKNLFTQFSHNHFNIDRPDFTNLSSTSILIGVRSVSRLIDPIVNIALIHSQDFYDNQITNVYSANMYAGIKLKAPLFDQVKLSSDLKLKYGISQRNGDMLNARGLLIGSDLYLLNHLSIFVDVQLNILNFIDYSEVEDSLFILSSSAIAGVKYVF